MINFESINPEQIKLFNIVDMGLSFSAMIRLYEKDSKRKIHEKFLEALDDFATVYINKFWLNGR